MNRFTLAGTVGKYVNPFKVGNATKISFSVGIPTGNGKKYYVPAEVWGSTPKSTKFLENQIATGATINLNGRFNHSVYHPKNNPKQTVVRNDIRGFETQYPAGTFGVNVGIVNGYLASDARIFKTQKGSYHISGMIISNDGYSSKGKELTSAVPFGAWTNSQSQIDYWKKASKKGAFATINGRFNPDRYPDKNNPKVYHDGSAIEAVGGAYQVGPKNARSQSNTPQQNNGNQTVNNNNNQANNNANNNNANNNNVQHQSNGGNTNSGNNNSGNNNSGNNTGNGNANGNTNGGNTNKNPKIDISDDDLPF